MKTPAAKADRPRNLQGFPLRVVPVMSDVEAGEALEMIRKTTKIIRLVEELRHDLPMVKDRHDQRQLHCRNRWIPMGYLQPWRNGATKFDPYFAFVQV